MNKSDMMTAIINAAIQRAVRALKRGKSYTDVLSECTLEECESAVKHECDRYGYRYSNQARREWVELYQGVVHSTVRIVAVQERCDLVPKKNGK